MDRGEKFAFFWVPRMVYFGKATDMKSFYVAGSVLTLLGLGALILLEGAQRIDVSELRWDVKDKVVQALKANPVKANVLYGEALQTLTEMHLTNGKAYAAIVNAQSRLHEKGDLTSEPLTGDGVMQLALGDLGGIDWLPFAFCIGGGSLGAVIIIVCWIVERVLARVKKTAIAGAF